PQQALAGINTVLPETVIDAVFEDLKAEHPLLSAINFTNTGALVKILLSTTGGVAAWGTLDATITSELSASFTEVDLSLAKLTAFIPVNKYMIELGPQWIDNYVRQLLTEAIAVQLEVGIVAGSGKNQPIGMMKKLSGATDGVYPNKTAVVVTSLSPASYGAILDTLSTGPNSKRRAVQNVLLIVNPSDYFTKVFPATTVRATDGSYSKDVFPYPTSLIQSAAVPAGKAVFGLASKYFMGMGTQSGGKIEYSDEYKFLEQQRVYLTYLYGYGRAMDENAFVLADISGLVPVTQEVVVNEVKAVVKTKEQV
ncbi:MAG: phage major capsid protein, partial [Oscillospiraceae bacterium]